MTFVRTAFFPGGTAAHHAALAEELGEVPVPEGRLAFLAGPTEGGWLVVQAWRDRDELDAFNARHLLPALRGLGDRGFPSPPVVRDTTAHDEAWAAGPVPTGRSRRPARVVPGATARLRFREMGEADLDAMAALLGDPEVMRFYPAPIDRAEALGWIRWNQRNYAEHGHGLWVVETHAGEFVGDCGLTWQPVDGEQVLEVGYHVVTSMQGRGYATEAARACVELATGPLGQPHVVAIVVPDNVPSRRVAEKVGLRLEQETEVHGRPAVVLGTRPAGGLSS